MNHNFINFHVLISHSPSCLNRDDMNMQKNAIFGGKRRVRVSSQSLKRAMRTSPYYKEHIGEHSIRTKKISELRDELVKRLTDKFDEELVTYAIGQISGQDLSQEVVEDDAVAPWAIGEVAWFCEQIKQAREEGLDEKAINKQLKQSTEAMKKALESGVDIALSGRMATSGLMSKIGKVDGAMSIAHAITTHAVDSDIDWFTAVDDLQELGSGHLDTQEFSSGVFYRYASLNIGQLQENLGGCSRDKALEIASHVLHMLATVVPSAKQQSHAAYNPADLALVSFSDIPISLANAYEAPVRASNNNGFLKPSLASLNTYWDKVHKGYGLNESCAEFILDESITLADGIEKMANLPDLEKWVCQGGGNA